MILFYKQSASWTWFWNKSAFQTFICCSFVSTGSEGQQRTLWDTHSLTLDVCWVTHRDVLGHAVDAKRKECFSSYVKDQTQKECLQDVTIAPTMAGNSHITSWNGWRENGTTLVNHFPTKASSRKAPGFTVQPCVFCLALRGLHIIFLSALLLDISPLTFLLTENSDLVSPALILSSSLNSLKLRLTCWTLVSNWASLFSLCLL